jgi:hypothetical protein
VIQALTPVSGDTSLSAMADDISVLREQWRLAKTNLDHVAKAGNKRVKDLLKSFDQGLGPAMDKWVKAGKTGNAADFAKYGKQAPVVAQEYTKRIKALPDAAWGDDHGRQARDNALAKLETLDDAVEQRTRKYL